MMICFQNWQKNNDFLVILLYVLCFVPVNYDTYLYLYHWENEIHYYYYYYYYIALLGLNPEVERQQSLSVWFVMYANNFIILCSNINLIPDGIKNLAFCILGWWLIARATYTTQNFARKIKSFFFWLECP